MNAKKAILYVVLVAFVGVLAFEAWLWRQPLIRFSDPSTQAVLKLEDQAYKEIREIKQAGGDPVGLDQAARKWADRLWKYREDHPRTSGAAMATASALELLAGMSRRDELLARANILSADDQAISYILYILYTRAESKQDFPAFIAFAQELRAQRNSDQPEEVAMRARLDYHIGRAYDALRDAPQARAAFQRAIQGAPTSRYARDAELGLYELDHLSVGQPAPHFAGTDQNGKPFALADLRGRTVLLDFWGKG